MKIDNTLKIGATLTLFLIVAITAFITSSVTAKGIYKCMKPDGGVEYTQFPSENCKDQQIKKRGGTADQGAIDKLHEDKKRDRIAADEQNEKKLFRQDQDRVEKEKQEYCESVRANLEQITIANRVFETDDQGNRTRLDEEQRQQRIQENKDSIAEHCS